VACSFKPRSISSIVYVCYAGESALIVCVFALASKFEYMNEPDMIHAKSAISQVLDEEHQSWQAYMILSFLQQCIYIQKDEGGSEVRDLTVRLSICMRQILGTYEQRSLVLSVWHNIIAFIISLL